MRKLFLLVVLFATTFYGQNENYISNGFQVAESVDEGWKKLEENKTIITFKTDTIRVWSYKADETYLVKFKGKEKINESGDKKITYNCIDDEGVELKIYFVTLKNANKDKQFFLVYKTYMVSYDMFEVLTSEDYLNLGISKSVNQEHETAILHYSKAIELNPKYVTAYINRSSAKSSIKDFNGALADCNKAIEIESKNSFAYYNRGAIKKDMLDYNGAIIDFDLSILINPKDAQTYFQRGEVKSLLENEEDAILDYNKAIELDAEYIEAFYSRAFSRANTEDFEGAVKDLTKVIELNSEISEAYYYIGFLKINHLNEKESGCTFLKKAINLGSEEAKTLSIENCN